MEDFHPESPAAPDRGVEHFSPVRVTFLVNAPELRPPVAPQAPVMPDNAAAAVVDFEDENGVDDDRALQEACRNAQKVTWEETDL